MENPGLKRRGARLGFGVPDLTVASAVEGEGGQNQPRLLLCGLA